MNDHLSLPNASAIPFLRESSNTLAAQGSIINIGERESASDSLINILHVNHYIYATP